MAHTHKKRVCCITQSDIVQDDKKTSKTSPSGHYMLVVDTGNNKIPLWAPNQTLTWKYSYDSSDDKSRIEEFEAALKRAIAGWGSSAPVKLEGPKSVNDHTDFVVILYDEVNEIENGRFVLGQAFFPNTKTKRFHIWATPEELKDELVVTIEHELGHVFGLRHYFGISEEVAPGVVGEVAYYKHDPNDERSIMNYGEAGSSITSKDKSDLKSLYNLVWTI